jgi:hypothetical protein
LASGLKTAWNHRNIHDHIRCTNEAEAGKLTLPQGSERASSRKQKHNQCQIALRVKKSQRVTVTQASLTLHERGSKRARGAEGKFRSFINAGTSQNERASMLHVAVPHTITTEAESCVEFKSMWKSIPTRM